MFFSKRIASSIEGVSLAIRQGYDRKQNAVVCALCQNFKCPLKLDTGGDVMPDLPPVQEKEDSISAIRKANKGKVVEVASWSDIPLGEGEYLMTIDHAMMETNVVRSVLFNLRKNGLLTTYNKGRCVRLISSEIEKMKTWYCVPKGKI